MAKELLKDVTIRNKKALEALFMFNSSLSSPANKPMALFMPDCC
jgi:hypothetical protein